MLSILNRLWVYVASRRAAKPAVLVTGSLAGVTIYDQTGAVRDEAWLYARFGNVERVASSAPVGEAVFRLFELREKEGPTALIVKTLDDQGRAMAGVNCIFTWPTADKLPDWNPPPERWLENGVYGPTNSDGDVGFGMGGGGYYDPKTSQGPHSAWVGRPSTYSDWVKGLGMLPFTNHIHLDCCFKLTTGDDEPEPPTPPDDDVLAYLDAMYEILTQIRDRLAAGWKVTPA